MKKTEFHRQNPHVFARQVRALTIANLKTRYRNTITGFLWVVFNPIMMFGAQSYAFHLVLKINVVNYLLFLLSGLLPWVFIGQSIEMTTSSMLNQGKLLKSFPIHPMVNLSAQIIDNVINFLAAFFIILLPVSFYYHIQVRDIFLLPIPLFIMILGVFSISWILSTAQVFFQDLRFIVTFGISIMFFFTPIFYPEDLVPVHLRWVLDINIIYYLIKPFRALILEENSNYNFWQVSGQGLLISVSLFIIANFYWSRKRNAVYFNI